MSGQKLGQNFLVDLELAQKIVDTLDLSLTKNVLEIGPGRGVLTKLIAKTGANLVALEYDEKLAENLQTQIKDKNVTVLHKDARLFVPNERFLDEGYLLIGNLPYYAGKKILTHFVSIKSPPKQSVVMLQKEVADVLCAKEGALNYFALSIRVFADPTAVIKVSPNSFNPKPKVSSTVLSIKNEPVLQNYDPSLEVEPFLNFVKKGFKAPRKLLTNSLSRGLNLDNSYVKEMLLQLSPGLTTKRPANLSVKNWVELYHIWENMGKKEEALHKKRLSP